MEPASPILAGGFFISASPGKPYTYVHIEPDTYVHIEPDTYVHIEPDTYVHIEPDTYVHIEPYTYVHIEPYTYVYVQVNSVYIQSLLRKSKERQGPDSTTTECLPRVLQSISRNYKIYVVRNYYYPHLTNE